MKFVNCYIFSVAIRRCPVLEPTNTYSLLARRRMGNAMGKATKRVKGREWYIPSRWMNWGRRMGQGGSFLRRRVFRKHGICPGQTDNYPTGGPYRIAYSAASHNRSASHLRLDSVDLGHCWAGGIILTLGVAKQASTKRYNALPKGLKSRRHLQGPGIATGFGKLEYGKSYYKVGRTTGLTHGICHGAQANLPGEHIRYNEKGNPARLRDKGKATMEWILVGGPDDEKKQSSFLPAWGLRSFYYRHQRKSTGPDVWQPAELLRSARPTKGLCGCRLSDLVRLKTTNDGNGKTRWHYRACLINNCWNRR